MRTKQIAKTVGTDDDNNIMLDTQQILTKIEAKTVKHSKNIIDLIGAGDILQVEISEEWVAKEDTIRFIIVSQTYTLEEIKDALDNGIYKIKSIVTKQQFENIEYKI